MPNQGLTRLKLYLVFFGPDYIHEVENLQSLPTPQQSLPTPQHR